MTAASRHRQKSLEQLVTEARHLRDHLVHDSTEETTHALTAALWPFDSDAEVGEQEIKRLYGAFQAAHQDAVAHIDEYTLKMVLRGKSPHHTRNPIFNSVILAGMGMLFVLLAFHFSYWSSRTTFVLEAAEEFSEFDHFASVMKLVELETYFSQRSPDERLADLEPHLLYLEAQSILRDHYSDEAHLPGQMWTQLVTMNPVVMVHDRLKRVVCTPTGEQTWATQLVGCEPVLPVWDEAEGQMAGLDVDPKINGVVPTASRDLVFAPSAGFRNNLDQVRYLRDETMRASGRSPNVVDEYAVSTYQLRLNAEQLMDKLNIVHRWALPIIYGALGSVVYCIWRVLSPHVAPLNMYYAILRTAFAGLAALTLSMLLVPASAVNVGADASRPMIYLLAFIFGYSIEAFVATLNALNQKVSETVLSGRKSMIGR
ncbi:MAG: hypothetical protein AAF919_05775 [Pseudomonadota bacterium]